MGKEKAGKGKFLRKQASKASLPPSLSSFTCHDALSLVNLNINSNYESI
jgi:hypothetical protein